MTDGSPETRKRTLERRLMLFAVLYAVAALFEMRSGVLRVVDLPNAINVTKTLCCLAAAGLLLRPKSLDALAVFVALHAAAIYSAMPRTPNHWMLGLLIDLSLLFAYARVRWDSGRGAPDSARYFELIAPAVRWSMFALYFWAVFHKLNIDFFDRDISCASVQLFRLERIWPFLPLDAWARELAIYGTLVVEVAIPVLMAVRRTRLLGVALGVGFHWSLGFIYTGFSMNLFAFFTFFVPGFVFESWSRIDVLLRRAAAGSGLFAAVFFGLQTLYEDHVFSVIGIGWMFYGIFALMMLLPSLWPDPLRSANDGDLFVFPRKGMLVFPLLFLLNGANPYLGLKNIQALSMFSNLRTEAGQSNHLLIPASWQLFDYQRDLVTIRSSSDSVLQELTEPRHYIHFFRTAAIPFGHPLFDGPAPTWKLPYVSLRARVKHYKGEGRKNLTIVYERDGQRFEVERAEEDPELSRISYLAAKFFLLRAVSDGDRGICLW